MSLHRITRRHALLWPAAFAIPSLGHGQAARDGAARTRALATRSACLDIARAGDRLVAVGERGHVLLSDDQGRQWRQARSVPTRATLTAVQALGERQLWAVGHGGVILGSKDGGESWQPVFGQADGKDVLLSIHVGADGRGLAVGGFGLALATADGGASWQRRELIAGEEGERHLNRIFTLGASTWLIAAEGGHVLRSDDRGEHWQAVKTPYAGSLWHGAALPGGALLACGMRGNIVRSSDDGRSWTHQAIAGAGSLTAIAQGGAATLALVGVDGTLVTSRDGGATLALRQLADRATLTGAVFLPSGALAVASAAGVRIVRLDPA